VCVCVCKYEYQGLQGLAEFMFYLVFYVPYPGTKFFARGHGRFNNEILPSEQRSDNLAKLPTALVLVLGIESTQ
jgi:hypothetical protein